MIHPYSYYLARAARRWPEQVALIDGERRLGYGELDRRVGSLAAALRALGLRPGDRVAIVQENTFRYVEAVCAVARAGGVFVPMLGALTDREHAAMVADSGARMVIALSPAGGARARAFLQDAGEVVTLVAPGEGDHDYEELVAAHEPCTPEIDRHPDDLAQILYTSGTTGEPKGVMHSLASTAAAMGAWVAALGLRHEDRLLGHFALSHFGGRVMDSSWCVGATLVILPRPDVEAILAAVAAERITVLLMVPTLLKMILDGPALARHDLSSLRLVLYAAAPASAALVRRAWQALGPVLATGFGQTEAYGLNTFLSPAEHEAALAGAEERLGSVGREAEAWVQVQVVDDEGRPLPPGQVGEICVSAPWVMRGYWGRPELSAHTLRAGWLHTRDLGRQDRDGYLYLVDRKEDMIITGGYNVAPREVEEVIAALAGVRECCVVGVPDAKWGEAVHAVVVAEGVDEAAVLAHCRASLPAFKVPKAVTFVSSLPRSGVGKVLRRVVREQFWAGKERRVHGAE